MTTDPLNLTAAFMIGLASAGHCLGMCGGLTLAAGLAVENLRKDLALLMGFHAGRVASYTALGATFGLFTQEATDWLPQINLVMRFIAGALLVAMGLYLSNLWRGLAYLEKIGQGLWRKLQPQASRLIPIQNPAQALMLGFMWVALPCGLIYSTLAWSATAQNWQTSALLMLFFGFGTLPVLLISSAGGQAFKTLLTSTTSRYVMSAFLVCLGLWTILGANTHPHTGTHSDIHLTEHTGH